MDIAGLTTSEAVRVLLGISEEGEELTEDVFANSGLIEELPLKLNILLKKHASNLSPVPTVASITTLGGSALNLLKLAAKYVAALFFVPTLATSTAKKLGDGQDEFQRQDRDLAQIKADLEAQLWEYLEGLIEELGGQPGVAFTIMSAASPTTDPITGT